MTYTYENTHAQTIHVGTDDMRKKMGEILDCVYLKGDEFLIERKNKTLAALIPVAKFQALTSLARTYLLQSLERINLDLTEEESYELAEEAKKAVRNNKTPL